MDVGVRSSLVVLCMGLMTPGDDGMAYGGKSLCV
jgi:hypothetical protein